MTAPIEIADLEPSQAEPLEESAVRQTRAEAESITLREKKFARTKLALMRAAVARLRVKSFNDVTVKELCEEAQVSEATFFNYFPKKDDVLRYFIQIWMVEVTWEARQSVGADSGLRFIEALFDIMGRELGECPRIMLEVISFMTLDREGAGCPFSSELSLAERLQAFPEMDCASSVPCQKLDQVLAQPIQRAAAQGELPADANIEASVVALLSLFFGVPLLLKEHPEQIRETYKQQLQLVWAGVRNRSASSLT